VVAAVKSVQVLKRKRLRLYILVGVICVLLSGTVSGCIYVCSTTTTGSHSHCTVFRYEVLQHHMSCGDTGTGNQSAAHKRSPRQVRVRRLGCGANRLAAEDDEFDDEVDDEDEDEGDDEDDDDGEDEDEDEDEENVDGDDEDVDAAVFEGVTEDNDPEPYARVPLLTQEIVVGMLVMGRWSDDDNVARQWYTARVTEVHRDSTASGGKESLYSLRFMGDPVPLMVSEDDIGKRRVGTTAV
jgi:hypothetical protein